MILSATKFSDQLFQNRRTQLNKTVHFGFNKKKSEFFWETFLTYFSSFQPHITEILGQEMVFSQALLFFTEIVSCCPIEAAQKPVAIGP